VFAADPVVEECLPFAPQSSLFISCGVGNRELWATFMFIVRLWCCYLIISLCVCFIQI